MNPGWPRMNSGWPMMTPGWSWLTQGDPWWPPGWPMMTPRWLRVTQGDPWVTQGDPLVTQGYPWVTQGNPWVTQGDSWVIQSDPLVTRVIPRLPFCLKVHRGSFWVLFTCFFFIEGGFLILILSQLERFIPIWARLSFSIPKSLSSHHNPLKEIPVKLLFVLLCLSEALGFVGKTLP